MTVTSMGVNSPNGNVGVNGWLRNAEMERWTPGVVRGFNATWSGMTVHPAGGDHYNVCIAYNGNEDYTILASNKVDGTSFDLTAPNTSGQSVCYALVAYWLPSQTATNNDGVGTVNLTVVRGTPTISANVRIPTESAIRASITNGAEAYICVVGSLTIPYGATTIDPSYYNTIALNNDIVNLQTTAAAAQSNGDVYNSNPRNPFYVAPRIETAQIKIPYFNDYPTFVRYGHVASMTFRAGPITTVEPNNINAAESLPIGWRPATSGLIVGHSANGRVFDIKLDADGSMHITGSLVGGYYYQMGGAWVIA